MGLPGDRPGDLVYQEPADVHVAADAADAAVQAGEPQGGRAGEELMLVNGVMPQA
jgi:hypothetical protein